MKEWRIKVKTVIGRLILGDSRGFDDLIDGWSYNYGVIIEKILS